MSAGGKEASRRRAARGRCRSKQHTAAPRLSLSSAVLPFIHQSAGGGASRPPTFHPCLLPFPPPPPFPCLAAWPLAYPESAAMGALVPSSSLLVIAPFSAPPTLLLPGALSLGSGRQAAPRRRRAPATPPVDAGGSRAQGKLSMDDDDGDDGHDNNNK